MTFLTNSTSVLTIFIASLLVLGCFLTDGKNSVIGKRCTQCHSVERIYNEKRSLEEWQDILDRMVRHGATITEEERASLLNHLTNAK